MDPETCGTANTLLYLGADIDMQMLKYLGANETHAIYVDPLVSSTGVGSTTTPKCMLPTLA